MTEYYLKPKEEKEIKYKNDQDDMRVCFRDGCGKVLTTQIKYCGLKCKGFRRARAKKSEPFSKWPSWCCDKCGEVIELDFHIKKHSARFTNIKKEHVCLKK